MIKISENLNKLSKRLSPLFVVGGFVRDSLLGQSPTDVDLAAPHTLDQVILVLGKDKVIIKNKALGTAQIIFNGQTYEYSTFRVEEYIGGKHNPKKAGFTKDILLDAKRRDFCVNAIYFDLQNKKLIDPFGGVQDIKNKTLRMVENSLEFDGIRILRLIRFAVELGFEIESNTWVAAKKYSLNLDAIKASAKQAEFDKISPQNRVLAEELLLKLL